MFDKGQWRLLNTRQEDKETFPDPKIEEIPAEAKRKQLFW